MNTTSLQAPIHFPELKEKINFDSNVFFIGSCFSEHISQRLKKRKVSVLSNPYGILFDSLAIERCIEEIEQQKIYKDADLFLYDEIFHSWQHHSDFSSMNRQESLDKINHGVNQANAFIKKASHIVITLGSAYSYLHMQNGQYVSNCHKLPQTAFHKSLIQIDDIVESLKNTVVCLKKMNTSIQIIFTVSPVRHLRDGVIENNRSKARLLEAIHTVLDFYPNFYYFPSYEIVLDVLRDYRFFDIDLAHPNYLATDIVFDFFSKKCIDVNSLEMMHNFLQLAIAKYHKPRFPHTLAHRKFVEKQINLCIKYQSDFPELNFAEDLNHFQSMLTRN